MLKARVYIKKSINLLIQELIILSYLKHPLIVNIHSAFQDDTHLYLISDYAAGGDLRSYIMKGYQFTEEESKFFMVCILLGLDYIHTKGIIHKDIKGRNLLFDINGYLKLADFGIAEIYQYNNFGLVNGTLKYMSPEVACGLNHGPAADYFSVGIILYELMMKIRPYRSSNFTDYILQMLKNPVMITKEEVPEGWSYEAADFINKLTQISPSSRLGYNGFDEIKNHPWLKDVKWESYLNYSVIPPFIPEEVIVNDSPKFLEKLEKKKEQDADYLKNLELLKNNSTDDFFINYWYDENNLIYKEIFI